MVNANAASSFLSFSNLLRSSEEKCWASAAEPPFPQHNTLLPIETVSAIISPACTILSVHCDAQSDLTLMLSSIIDRTNFLFSTLLTYR